MLPTGGLRNRVGISFDSRVVGELDRPVEASVELAVTRSEIVNAIVSSFLESDPREALPELVMERRKGNRVKETRE